MEDYEMITRLGGGSFADVYKARNKITGELVAIKILKKKYKKLEDCTELRECRSLQILNKVSSFDKGFDNIINLKNIIFTKKTGVLNLVFEYMDKDLFQLMKSFEPKHIPENKIKDLIYQTLQGLSFMHKYGFFHRDIKPENLLLTNDKIKIADFGLAREIRTLPPYTEYVSTRYYRAPECILKSTNYNSPIDIWALGCVMAEMYLHPMPLFYGTNEKEVLYRICSILGTPNHDNWPEGVQLAYMKDIKFPNCNKIELEDIIKDASTDAIDLMKRMLKWDPKKRETAENLLRHKFFEEYFYKDFNYNIEFESTGINRYFEKNYFNNNNNNLDSINRYDITSEKNTNSKENIDNDLKLSKNISINESIEKPQKENECKKEKDNFSGLLNDTDGFNKLLNELKKEKIEEDNDFEKQKNKNEYNNLWLSIEKNLDINTNESNKNVNRFIKEIENKEKNEKEKVDFNFKKVEPDKIKDNENIEENPKLFREELNYKNKINLNNKDNNINQNNEIKRKPIDLGLNLNNYNDSNNLTNLINKDNNIDFNFENAKILKPIIKNNRRGSARKFLEENENKMKQNNNINLNLAKNTLENNNDISIGKRRIKYNFSNDVLPRINNNKKHLMKPALNKNQFSFMDNYNNIFNNQQKEEINSYKQFNNGEFGYGQNVSLTNNNVNLPFFLRDNKNEKLLFQRKNEQKNKPNILLNKNFWNL